MTVIAPSLLACDFLNLEGELKALSHCQNIWLHLDIMDGHFVPNLTFGHEIIKAINAKSEHLCDAHFMVTNPEFYLDTLKTVPLHNFTFHYEAVGDALSFAKDVRKTFPSAGISIKPGTDIEVLSDDLLRNLDLVLIMSVEPGFGGQSFMPDSLNKVRTLVKKRKELGLNFVIQIDGGINETTAPLAIEAGADNLVAGSAVFKHQQSQYNTIIESLRSPKC